MDGRTAKVGAAAVAYGLPAACALAVVAPILLHAGLPAYHHDWSLPFDTYTLRQSWLGHYSMWDPSGFGSPNPLAAWNPLFAFIAGTGYLAPAVTGDKIIIAAAFVCAALCMALAVRRALDASPLACAAAAVAFVCSPVLFNKLGAGHVGFWWAYALLPLVYDRAAAVARGDRAAIPSLAIVAALSSIQTQFVAFDVIVAAVVALYERGPLRWAAPLTVVVAAGIANAATVYAIFSSGKTLFYHVPTPLRYWDDTQSTPLPGALSLAHYLQPSYEKLAPWPIALWAIPVLAAAGCVVRFRTRVTATCVTIAAIGLLIVTGTLGPAAPFWTWAFAHVWAATVMREFYNAAALVSLAYALAIAQGVTAMPARFAAAVPLALIAASIPMLDGGTGRVIPNVTAPAYVERDLDALRYVQSGKVLSLPSLIPLVEDRLPVGGMDAFAVRDAAHGNATEFPTLFPLTMLAFGGDSGERWWLRVLQVANVAAIESRPDMMTAEPTARRGAGGISNPPFGLFALDPQPLAFFAPRSFPMPVSYAQLPDDGVGLTTSTGMLPGTRGPQRVAFASPSRVYDDPQRAWVDYGRWRFRGPHPEDASPEGVVTSSGVPLRVSTTSMSAPSVLLSANGRVRLACASGWQRGLTLNATVWYALPRGCGVLTVRTESGSTVVERVAQGSASVPLRTFDVPAIASESRPWPWEIDVHLRAAPNLPALLVFGERFSENWKVEGARVVWHGVAEGFANAWEIEPANRNLRLVYQPQRLFNWLSALAAAGYLVALVFWFMMRRSRWNALRG